MTLNSHSPRAVFCAHKSRFTTATGTASEPPATSSAPQGEAVLPLVLRALQPRPRRRRGNLRLGEEPLLPGPHVWAPLSAFPDATAEPHRGRNRASAGPCALPGIENGFSTCPDRRSLRTGCGSFPDTRHGLLWRNLCCDENARLSLCWLSATLLESETPGFCLRPPPLGGASGPVPV